MQEKQIIDEIIRYLQDENYRCAVMIDGNWGCGKTHFVLHDLKVAIEEYEEKNSKRNIKYISQTVDKVGAGIVSSTTFLHIAILLPKILKNQRI
ncbi:MAG: hypothetical protein KHY46_16115, partial [Clostridiales bacterium]|nr:hypothetical protein [Clostridiales bacterium]